MSAPIKLGAALGGIGIAAYLAKRKWDSLDADYTTYQSQLDKEYFRNRIVWITGSSTGIGKALTLYIASLDVGTKLVLSARREELLMQIKQNILSNKYSSITADNIYVLQIDLNTSNYNYLKEKYSSILNRFNVTSIDMLINNAGFSMRSYAIDFAPKDTIDMVNVNLITPIILTKFVLTDIINDKTKTKYDDNKFGHIVNVCSASARLLPATRSTYVATKIGLLGYTYSIDHELSEYKNINVTAIIPGLVQTDVDITARGKNGKGHNKRDDGIQNGMDSRRCAEIICTAISNKIIECWPSNQPVLQKIYQGYYFTPSKYDGREAISTMLKQAAGYLPSKL